MPGLRVSYKTMEIGSLDIHVRTLRDICQFQDIDGVAEKLGISSATWPLFGIIWPSGEVLAHLMLDYNVKGKRILEVGCGIGLASLVLSHRFADITASDLHPEAEAFLNYNVGLNNGTPIPFMHTGWADITGEAGKYDLIIGSDLLYEPDHAALLSGFVNHHAQEQCDVILVDPNRGERSGFSKNMAGLGYSLSKETPAHTEYLEKAYKGQILTYSR